MSFKAKSAVTENSFDPAVWAIAAVLAGAIVYLVLALQAVNMAPLGRPERTDLLRAQQE